MRTHQPRCTIRRPVAGHPRAACSIRGPSTPRACVLPRGRVVVTSNESLWQSEVYDPLSGSWQLSGAMVQPRLRHTANLLPGGRVLVTGGVGPGDVPLASAEVFQENANGLP